MSRQPRMTHKAESYFEHNAKRETAFDLIEFDPEPTIIVEEREITREEWERMVFDAVKVAR